MDTQSGQPNRYRKYIENPVYEKLKQDTKTRIAYFFQRFLVDKEGGRPISMLCLQDLEQGVTDIRESLLENHLGDFDIEEFIDLCIKPQKEKMGQEFES